jgi:error-prone DNA polymerase
MTRKRSREAMLRLWEQFREGATANGVDQETASTVFRNLLGFASYGFPKGHAASFAVLAYQSCWLKHHYPAEFLCALLNNQPMGFYSPSVLSNEAKRRGVHTALPDINLSGVRCTVQGTRTVRLGLGQIRRLGEEVAAAIVAERESAGLFRSVPDLMRRAPLPLEVVEGMALAGIFDPFGLARREAAWQAGLVIPPKSFGPKQRQEAAGRDRGRQMALALPVEPDMVSLPPTSTWERMGAELRVVGLSPRWHPMGLLRPQMVESIRSTKATTHLPDGTRMLVAGLVVVRQRPETAKGVTFLLLEDEHGLLNVIVPPALYEAQRHVVRAEPFVVVEGRLQRRLNTINLLAERIWPLTQAQETFGTPEQQSQPQEHESLAEAATPAHSFR